jgi:predicted metal-dependent peptidase
MTPIDRIKKAHVSIMRHKRFCAFSGVLACGETSIDDTIPTACTNGWDKKYNSTFVTKDLADDRHLRFVVLHEAMHAAYKHMTVWKVLWKEHAQLANIAADHFANLALQDMDKGEGFIQMPKVGVQPDAKYRGWSVQQIFDDLKQQAKQQPQGGGGGQGEGDGDGQGQGGGLDEHDWESAGSKDAKTQAAQAQEIDRALRQGEALARKRGEGAGSSEGVLGDLLKPQVDWREKLREFVQQTCQGNDESTWRKPNRRYLTQDMYMPSMHSETMGELVIGFDTSGSCFGGTVMNRFASELTAIIASVRPEKTRVIYWDAVVQFEQVFDNGEFSMSSLTPRGGGGTDGSVLAAYVKDKRITPQAIVQFTDGYVGSWGDEVAPTLWAITESHIRAPFGQTVHITTN